MQYDQDILLNFPKLCNPHARGVREFFFDYGIPLSTDVELQRFSDGKIRLSFLYQRRMSCDKTNLTLTPRGPCRPVTMPNPYQDIEKEPCMSKLNEENRDIDELLSFSSNFCTFTKIKKDTAISLLKEKLSEIKCVKEDGYGMQGHPENGNASSSDFTFDVKTTKLFSSVAGIARHGSNILRDYGIMWKKDYNPLYAGGCVSFQPLDRGKDLNGVLVFPSGERMDHIALGSASFNSQSEIILKKDLHLPDCNLGTLIYQVSLETVKNRILCVARTKKFLSIFGIDDGENNNVILNHLMTSDSRNGSVLSHATLSPHLMGEFLITSTDGTACLWSLERSQREIHRVSFPPDPIGMALEGHPSYCHFTSHPRCFLISTNNSISIVDARTPHSKSSNLFTLSCSGSLHKGEKITCSYKPNMCSRHHLFATQLSLGVIDERFPEHLVLKWNHTLLTSPAFMDSMHSVMGIENESLISLASQDHGEVHFFQSHGVGVPFEQLKCHPSKIQMCGPPWRACRPEELLMSFKEVKNRLTCPLIGQCLVPNESLNGFSIVQVTSVGDVFSQEYSSDPVSQNNSKAFTKPTDSHGDDSLESFREPFENWLKVCQDFEYKGAYKNEQKLRKSKDALMEIFVDANEAKRLKLDSDINENTDVKYFQKSIAFKQELCTRKEIGYAEKNLSSSFGNINHSRLSMAISVLSSEDDIDGQTFFNQYCDKEYQELLRIRSEKTMDIGDMVKDEIPTDEETVSNIESDHFTDDENADQLISDGHS